MVSLFVAAAAFAMLVVVAAIAIGIAATAAFIGKVAAQLERRFVHNSHRIGMEL